MSFIQITLCIAIITDDNDDKTLAQILASLADESCSPSSQAAASEVAVLEEQDSILREQAVVPDDEAVQHDEKETLEMSQVVWDDGSQEQEDRWEILSDCLHI